MPPSDAPALSKSQIRNRQRKRERQLHSSRSLVQKNHVARLEKELVVLNDAAKKTEGELACTKIANDRLQSIAQSATLDAIIFKRTADNYAAKLMEKDRVIASLTSATATESPL